MSAVSSSTSITPPSPTSASTKNADRDARFAGSEYNNSKIFEGIVFPKFRATDSPEVLANKRDLHSQQLYLIQLRYQARIVQDQLMLHG